MLSIIIVYYLDIWWRIVAIIYLLLNGGFNNSCSQLTYSLLRLSDAVL